MNDLNVIQRKNSEASSRDIPNQIAAGKTVVAEYHGLHYVGHEAFDGPDAAEKAAARKIEIEALPGQRGVIQAPATVAEAA